MIAPGNSLIQALLALAFVIASGYACGRIHQSHRNAQQRNEAYRHGYNVASDSMFDLALRKRAQHLAPVQDSPADRATHRPRSAG